MIRRLTALWQLLDDLARGIEELQHRISARRHLQDHAVAPLVILHAQARRAILGAAEHGAALRLTAPGRGSVREFEHVVAPAALRAGVRPIAAADVDGIAAASPIVPVVAPPIAEWSPADEALRARLVAALASHAGNISAAARALGRHRKQIHRWIARLGIDARAPR